MDDAQRSRNADDECIQIRPFIIRCLPSLFREAILPTETFVEIIIYIITMVALGVTDVFQLVFFVRELEQIALSK